MYTQQIINKLKEGNIKFTMRGKEIQCRCLNPNHKDTNPSFSINTTSGLYNCFSCGFKGNIHNLWDNIEVDEEAVRLSQYSSLLDSWELEVSSPKEYLEELLPPVDHYIDYPVRGLSVELLKSLGAYYCTTGWYKGRVVFPVRDTEGILRGFESRIYSSPKTDFIEPNMEQAKYLRPNSMNTKSLLFPLDYVANNFQEDYIILTEGIFDALSYIQMGYPAVCNFGLSHPDLFKVGYIKSLGVTTIINGLDTDNKAIDAWQGKDGKPGLKHTWSRWFTIGKPLDIIKTVRAYSKDANEYLQLYYDETKGD